MPRWVAVRMDGMTKGNGHSEAGLALGWGWGALGKCRLLFSQSGSRPNRQTLPPPAPLRSPLPFCPNNITVTFFCESLSWGHSSQSRAFRTDQSPLP